VKQATKGFTIVEILVAVIVLSVGVTALVGTAGMVTRMVQRGKMSTRAADLAAKRMERLRLAALSTTPRCTSGTFASGGPATYQGVTETWVVGAAAALRTVTVNVSYKTAQGTHTDVLTTQIRC
jgi:prepilin-type N-terminal cleavage/methylation domain-containing protein